MEEITMALYNGIEIPSMGLGPGIMGSVSHARKYARWNLVGRGCNKLIVGPWDRFVARPKKRADFVGSIAAGIKSGFRLIDYSAAYGDGGLIADAIDESGVSRKEIFLTGRVSNHAQFEGRQAVRDLIKRHLEEYRTDYVDVLMFHWPVTGHFEDTWREICEAYEKGQARSIGVANCHPHHLEKLMKCGLKPMLNQFEVHPLFTQKDLIKYNQDLGILVESYTPIARMDARLFRLPALKLLAEAHGKSPVQIVLRWHIQQGLVPIVRSANPMRQKQNLEIFDFELTEEEMKMIDSFNINSRLRYDPDNCDFTIL